MSADARAIGVVRLSKDDDASTSVERQRESIQALATAKGLQVVALVEDVDIPGDMAPWDRPALGRWLPNPSTFEGRHPERRRLDDFSHVIVWKLDRLSRRTVHLLRTVEMLAEQKITLHSVDDGYDPSSPAGQMMLAMLGTVAQGEHQAMKLRAKQGRKKLRDDARWPGGTPPFGYSVVKADPGFRLVVDPAQAAMLRSILIRITNGETINSIVWSMNDSGTLSPFDQQRVKSGKAPQGSKWRVSNLWRLLESPTLLGYATVRTTDGPGYQIIRRADGEPIQRAEPILTPDEMKTLRKTLESRRFSRVNKTQTRTPAPLTGLVKCGCGLNMYRSRGRSTSPIRLRCASRQTLGGPCGEGLTSVREDFVYSAILRLVRQRVGDETRTVRKFVPGTNNGPELARVNQSLQDLMDDRVAGLYSGPEESKRFREMFTSLELRRETLVREGIQVDSWIEEATESTWGDWLDENAADMHLVAATLIRHLGMTFVIHPRRMDAFKPGEDQAEPVLYATMSF